jgi:hypothetical protein
MMFVGTTNTVYILDSEYSAKNLLYTSLTIQKPRTTP